ncbi:MAG: hypothetical protein WCK34_01330 [Bacteroidota bacterium]
MKTRIFLFIGILLLGSYSGICREIAGNKAIIREGTINIASSPDIYNLAIKWAGEFGRLNPKLNLIVTKIPEGGTAALKPGSGLGFISRESDPAMKALASWNMVVARDVMVPFINTKNPFMAEISRKGISMAAFAQILKNPDHITWGALLGNGKNIPVHFYIMDDPSVKSALAGYVKANPATINAKSLETGSALITAIRNDPNAVGFCKLAAIMDVNNQNLAENITFLPIDKNGNGTIDYLEKIYENPQTFSRGVWIGKYPKALSGNIYAVAAGQPANENETAFLTWVLTDGQRYLNQQGFNDLVYSERQSQMDKLYFTPVTALQSTYSGSDILKVALLILIALVVIGSIVDIILRPGKKAIPGLTGTPGQVPQPFDENSVILPKGLYYDKTHIWAFMENDGSVKVGVDDFMQHITGPVTRVEMKNPGEKVKKGERLLTIIRNGKQLNLYAPLTGTITEYNNSLALNSSLLNAAPYTDGWVYKIEPTNWLRDIQFLTMAETYKTWLKDELLRLKDFFTAVFTEHTPEYATLVLQDGGNLTDGILADLDPKVWEDFQTKFIDTAK